MSKPNETIILDKLTMDQLRQVKEQLDQDMNRVDEGIEALRKARGGYEDTKTALETISPQNKGKPMMVPLTESLYVRGEVGDVESVLVTLGTGYFVERPVDKASDFLARKSEWVQQKIRDLEGQRQEIQMSRERIILKLNEKVRAAQEAEQRSIVKKGGK